MKEVTTNGVLAALEEVDQLHVTPEDFSTDLSELGVDSIMFIGIVVALEEAFDCEFPDSKLLPAEMKTIQDLVDVLQELYEEQCLNVRYPNLTAQRVRGTA